jgi:hypothetical protein
MNTDELTIGQVKELVALMNCSKPSAKEAKSHPFVGKYVIARCYSAGVHAGTGVSVDGDTCILKDSRRLWSWSAQDGVALSGVAQNGVKKGGKIDSLNPEIYLTGICELIPATKASKDSINA